MNSNKRGITSSKRDGHNVVSNRHDTHDAMDVKIEEMKLALEERRQKVWINGVVVE